MKEKFKNLCVVLVLLYTAYMVVSCIALFILSATDTNTGKKCKDFIAKVWEKIKNDAKKFITYFSHDDPVVE